MFCWTGGVLLVAKRQQTQLPAPVLASLIKYFTSLKSRSEVLLGDLGTAKGSLAARWGVLGYQVLDPGCRARCQILCIATYGESGTGCKTASVLRREKLQLV